MIEITNKIIPTTNGMKKNLDQTKQLVTDSISSIFTKQDVLDILNNIAMVNDKEAIIDNFRKIESEFNHRILHIRDGLANVDEAEFELNGNEIICTNVEVDTDKIVAILEEVISDLETDLEEQD
jgi:hypothetical protein